MARQNQSGRSTSRVRGKRANANAPRRKSTHSRRGSLRPHRFGPVFFTVVAITGLCAIAFLGLVASVMAGV